MENQKHYPNAPITEALIDIQVQVAAGVSLDRIEKLFDEIRADYPKKRSRIHIESQIVAGDAPMATSSQTTRGYAFYSADDRQVFQARLDGFTFSRLRPYQSWVQLRTEAERLWQIYRKAVEPVRITRVAVRYINQIDIPLPLRDFDEYLRTTPSVSPDLPQALSGMFMQLQFPQPDFGGVLVLRQAMLPPEAPEYVSVVLDIDAFKPDTDLGADDDPWPLLELLRQRKNEFFEGSITDKARDLFC